MNKKRGYKRKSYKKRSIKDSGNDKKIGRFNLSLKKNKSSTKKINFLKKIKKSISNLGIDISKYRDYKILEDNFNKYNFDNLINQITNIEKIKKEIQDIEEIEKNQIQLSPRSSVQMLSLFEKPSFIISRNNSYEDTPYSVDKNMKFFSHISNPNRRRVEVNDKTFDIIDNVNEPFLIPNNLSRSNSYELEPYSVNKNRQIYKHKSDISKQLMRINNKDFYIVDNL